LATVQAFFLDFDAGLLSTMTGAGVARFMIHCWMIATKLPVNQYNTSPADAF